MFTHDPLTQYIYSPPSGQVKAGEDAISSLCALKLEDITFEQAQILTAAFCQADPNNLSNKDRLQLQRIFDLLSIVEALS